MFSQLGGRGVVGADVVEEDGVGVVKVVDRDFVEVIRDAGAEVATVEV